MKEFKIEYTEQTRHFFFPTSVYSFQLADTEILDQYVKKLRDLRDHPDKLGNYTYFNWCSPDDLHQRSGWELLTSLITDRTEKVITDLGILFDSIRVNCMWANIHNSGSSHHIHAHPNSDFSGVLYLEVPDGEEDDPGNIFFRDTNRLAHQKVWNYKDGYKRYDIENIRPIKGKILIFPSWLEHGVLQGKYPENKERISLSWNATVIGKLAQANTIRAEQK